MLNENEINVTKESKSISHGDSEGLTKLQVLAYTGVGDKYINEMNHLLKSGEEKINAKSLRDGVTALMVATRFSRLPNVEFLLENAADPNIKDHEGSSTMHNINMHDPACEEILLLLLKKGGDINSIDKQGQTPLHLACNRGQDKLASLLLKYNADSITIRDNKGMLACSLAAKNGNTNIVNAFLNELFLRKDENKPIDYDIIKAINAANEIIKQIPEEHQPIITTSLNKHKNCVISKEIAKRSLLDPTGDIEIVDLPMRNIIQYFSLLDGMNYLLASENPRVFPTAAGSMVMSLSNVG